MLSFYIIIYIRKILYDDATTLNHLSFTPSDYCVEGHCAEFSSSCDYTIEGIEKEVTSVLKNDYGIEAIEYVTVAYDIEDIFLLLDRERELLKARELVNWFMEK